ncbi:MAG TPA: helix-turn-helix transcriptional regulator [Acidobacteriota bacterium]|nr:helix-turn-helix transcriptional regulator [Acidobacteriota bacterium]
MPLKEVSFHLLLAVADGAAHGYAMRKEVEDRTQGAIRLWPTTLYGTLRGLVEDGLLEERADQDDPRGKRSYRLTGLGRDVLAAETRRLEGLVRLARSTPALRGESPS